MAFGRWYPLRDAAAHAPAAEGVLQVRLAEGLVDYPRGKSAMVHYAHAEDVRAAVLALAAHIGDELGRTLLARHLEPGDPGGPAEIHAKVLAEFVRRFGAPPGFPP